MSDGFTKPMIDDFKRRIHEANMCVSKECPVCLALLKGDEK